MPTHLQTIKRIKINKEYFFITFLLVDRETERNYVKKKLGNQAAILKSLNKYYCAYVYLPKLSHKMYSEGLGNECTYCKGKVAGVDTAHYYNDNMTLEQKFEDAMRQIKTVIKDYNKKLRK